MAISKQPSHKIAMKRIIFTAAAILSLMACNKYELNTDFTVPDQLISPDPVVLDLKSPATISFSWSGGGAADGGILLYQVLFDEADGDFSEPITILNSDYGAETTLTMSQSELNNIARNAGIRPEETGTLKWTVTASKGGVVKRCDQEATFSVTRGEGIDNIPEHLYIAGSAVTGDDLGREFRVMSEGVYRIYTTLSDGEICFKSSMEGDAFNFYVDEGGKLREDEGSTPVEATSADGLVRITVDFNALTMTTEHLDQTVYYVLGIDGNQFVELHYDGNGQFSYTGLLPYMRDYWGSGAHEERYYFRVNIDGVTTYWGRGEGISAEQPSANEGVEFYTLHEYTDFNNMWNFAWKLKWDYFDLNTTVTIDTNSDNRMIHSFKFAE